MRILLLLRGSPGCGKTTWIEQNGLSQYALSADDIRLMCAGPTMTPDGKMAINPNNDNVVWATLFKLLEIRMQNGEFTVIDATNSKTSEMNRYKELCAAYKYRMYCVDFTSLPIEVVKERNRNRPELKRVPDEAIDKMYSRFQTQKIPAGITVLQPDELDRIWYKPMDFNQYKKIHHIGDIHGCYTALKQYLDDNGGMKDDEMYIFVGDYIDRGLENAEVVKFLLSVYQKPNVFLIEGNHERWLWIWANGGISKSKEFEFVAKTQLENAGIDKKDVRQLYRKIAQAAYYTYGNNTFVVTHAGLSTIPENISLVSTHQMTHGVGSYNSHQDIADAFVANTDEHCYQVHGHRNTKRVPVRANDRVFNLEGRVEFGGHLRCVQVEQDGTFTEVEVKNDVFREEETPVEVKHEKGKFSVGDVIIAMRENRYIQEKRYGNISSFNFTKAAFYDKIWDDQTITARGLYINIPKQKVVARAYNKFFNVNERPETKFDMLENRLAFPVTAYVKENGFLGIVSYNEEDDSLFVTTKSSPDGDFAVWLKDMIARKVAPASVDAMKEYAKTHNVSFVFECVDMTNDPHIIDYETDQLFLLDIVHNDMEFRKYNYEDMCTVADSLGLQHKEKAFVIESWQEFFDWYYNVTDEDYEYNGRKIEGFVIEDANGYMVKLKLHYYNFWKFMRNVSHEAIRFGYIRKTAALTTALSNQYYGWVRTLHDTENLESVPRDICTLRRMFFESEVGKAFKAE